MKKFDLVCAIAVLATVVTVAFYYAQDMPKRAVTKKVVVAESKVAKTNEESSYQPRKEKTDSRSVTEKELNRFGLTLKNSVKVSVRNK